MMEQRRGRNVAITGAIFQFIFTAVLVAIWMVTGSLAAMACIWMLAGGGMLWLMLIILFYCRQLARREQMELAEIAAQSSTGQTIFETEKDLKHIPATARLRFVERWIVPVFTLLWAAFHAAVGVWTLRILLAMPKGEPLAKALLREVQEELGIRVRVGRPLVEVRHAYSHFAVTIHAFQCEYVGGKPRCVGCTEYKWVRPDQLDNLAFPAANRKIIATLQKKPKPAAYFTS